MSPTVVLISGASRGLGRAIFERYIARPNHIVIAANRNPTDSNSKDLLSFKTGEGSKAILVKVDANVDTDAAEAVQKLETEHGIDHLDIVYANAGIATIVPKASAVTIEDLKAHMQANVYGLVTLLQATLPLLKKGTDPKWVTMGSQSGYLTNFLFFPNAAYGPSKVAAHWLTRALHDEEPWLTSIVIDPGRVQTDLGNAGAVIAGKMFGIEGMDKAELEIPTSVNGFVKVVDDASHDTHSGKLWTWEGQAVAW